MKTIIALLTTTMLVAGATSAMAYDRQATDDALSSAASVQGSHGFGGAFASARARWVRPATAPSTPRPRTISSWMAAEGALPRLSELKVAGREAGHFSLGDDAQPLSDVAAARQSRATGLRNAKRSRCLAITPCNCMSFSASSASARIVRTPPVGVEPAHAGRERDLPFARA